MRRLPIAVCLVIGTLGALGFAPPHGLDQQILSSKKIKNWGLINAIESQPPSHIHATEAWKIEEGSRDIVVAVIDTGIDPNHKDLSKNIWQDPKIKNNRVYGWNFITDSANPSDDHNHGTHVAGIIGAISDFDSGVSGVAHHVSIMAVKYYSEANTGSVNLRNTVKAIRYAADHGAKIINYSGGGPEFSPEEYSAIQYAESKGILFVAAAGNEHKNGDIAENYYYPAAYQLPNIISVAATDIHNRLLSSSNWGPSRVDVAAPGENIYSTLPGGRYGYMTGTSQATAFVSGLAALLLSQDPSLKPQQLKSIILTSVDPLTTLNGKVAANGRINAYSALMALRSRSFDKKLGDKKLGKLEAMAQNPTSFQNLLTVSTSLTSQN